MSIQFPAIFYHPKSIQCLYILLFTVPFVFRLHENVELDSVQPVSNLVVLRKHFVTILEERSAANGTLNIHKDSAYSENPMEREDLEEAVKVLLK